MKNPSVGPITYVAVIVMFAASLLSCPPPGGGNNQQQQAALWARTVSTGTADSIFTSIAVDTGGNVYAAGEIQGTGTYTFGSGVTAAGASGGYNVLLVKYDSSGTALWARTVSTGTADSVFTSIAVDTGGNVYAAGRIRGTGTYTFGSGVTAAGAYSGGDNVVLVKYDSSGTALWARTVSTGTMSSAFYSTAVDSGGNVYAAGYIRGIGGGTGTYPYTFGSGVTAAAGANGANVVLVKYDSSGTALWAQTVSTGTAGSEFYSTAVDTGGNVYAAGAIQGTGTDTFGSGVTAAGASGGYNVLLIKYLK